MSYFNAYKLSNPSREFVLWIDCMGTQCFMQRSIATAANFIFKFQSIVASHCALFTNMHSYPVMDGIYITSPSSNDILSVASSAMKELATLFTEQENVYFRFMVRGAISYGDVYHGDNVPEDAFVPKGESKKQVHIKKESILLGTPVTQAYQQETTAPPFGIALHSSCKLDPDRDQRFNNEWFAWQSDSVEFVEKLCTRVDEYFNHYKQQTAYSGYSKEKIENHHESFKQYAHLCKTLIENH